MDAKKPSIIKLYELLLNGEEVGYAEIMKRLGLSERQAIRLISDLKREDIPLLEDVRPSLESKRKRKVFFLAPHARRVHPDFGLTEEEALALALAAEATRTTLGSTPFGLALASAVRKLAAGLGDEEIMPNELDDGPQGNWHFGTNPTANIDPAIFRSLVQAIRDSRSVLFDYYSASTGRATHDRRVDPYALAVRDGSWMLAGWCHLRRGWRDFSVPGITNLRLGEPFSRLDFDPDSHFERRFGSVAGEGLTEVVLRVELDRIPYFRRKQYHPSQRIEERADGTVAVRFTVSGLEDIRSFTQSWGTGVTVEAPPELIRIVAREARDVAARYPETSV